MIFRYHGRCGRGWNSLAARSAERYYFSSTNFIRKNKVEAPGIFSNALFTKEDLHCIRRDR